MNNTAAVVIVYKWIPPYLKIYKDEVSFVIENDWFSFVIENDWFNEQYKDNPRDPTASPVLRLAESLQERFWDIAKRNNVSCP